MIITFIKKVPAATAPSTTPPANKVAAKGIEPTTPAVTIAATHKPIPPTAAVANKASNKNEWFFRARCDLMSIRVVDLQSFFPHASLSVSSWHEISRQKYLSIVQDHRLI